MKKQANIELLNRKYFILGLTILLINDFLLKDYLHNNLSGKLSDFSGLFIFPYFMSAIFQKQKKLIYFLTGIGFIFWKSSLSDPFLIWCSSNLFSIGRVKDFTDLISLTILPISYIYLNYSIRAQLKKNRYEISLMVGLLSIFSFCATSLPSQKYYLEINTNKNYILPFGKSKLFQKLNYNYGYSDNYDKNLVDSMFYCYFEIPGKWTNVTAITKIKEGKEFQTIIEIEKIVSFKVSGKFLTGINRKNVEFINSLTSVQFENYFEQNYINVLLEKKSSPVRGLFFDNKALIDKHIKE